MAQNQTLPLGSGLGAIRAPSLQGDANEAAFRRDASSGGLLGQLFNMYPTQQEAIDARKTAQSGVLEALQSLSSGTGSINPNLAGAGMDGSSSFFAQPEDAGAEVSDLGNIFEPDELSYDQEMSGGMTADAMGQILGGMKREQFPTRTDSLQALQASDQQEVPQELTTGELSGGAKSQTESSAVKGADNPAKQATVNALDEYLKAARPGVAPKDYAEYIKEFGEATGLDVSGEPDNKTALMAFGLALMQNKAGKGFDVGKMLSSVGEAGEKALPAMEAARKEAMAMRAKAGEYAISRKKEDKAAAMNRKGYYIIPAGASNSASGFLQAVQSGKGRLERLNDYELNSLDQNSEFNQQYDIIPADRYESVVSEVIKAANKGKDIKSYLETPQTISLFGSDEEVPDWAKVDIFYGNPNSNNKGNNVLAESPEAVLQRITSAQNGLLKEEKKFVKIADLLNKTDIDRLSQVGYSVVQFGRDFGINVTEQGTPLEQLKYLLKTIEVSETANILGEAGKTLSDVDRQLVRDIVGKIDWDNADEGLLKDKLREIYGLVITKGKENIANSFETLKKYGVQVDSGQTTSANSGGWTEGEDGVYRKASKQG
jgi:hypothetical protein